MTEQPPHGPALRELDLRDVWRLISARWLVLGLLVAAGAGGGWVYSLSIDESYRSRVILRPTGLEAYAELLVPALLEAPPQRWASKVYYWQLLLAVRSTQTRSDFLSQPAVRERIAGAAGGGEGRRAELTRQFASSLSTGRKSKRRVDANVYRVTAEGEAPDLSADLLNGFVAFAHRQTVASLVADVVARRDAILRDLDVRIAAEIEGLEAARRRDREAAERARHARLASLEREAATLRKLAAERHRERILELEAAASLAERLGIVEPAYLSVGDADREIGTPRLASADSTPAYFRGTRAIAAELSRARANPPSDASIEGLAPVLAAIDGLRDVDPVAAVSPGTTQAQHRARLGRLESERARYRAIEPDPDSIRLASIEPARPAREPFRPDRSKMVVLGALSGLLASLLLIARAASRDPCPPA